MHQPTLSVGPRHVAVSATICGDWEVPSLPSPHRLGPMGLAMGSHLGGTAMSCAILRISVALSPGCSIPPPALGTSGGFALIVPSGDKNNRKAQTWRVTTRCWNSVHPSECPELPGPLLGGSETLEHSPEHLWV